MQRLKIQRVAVLIGLLLVTSLFLAACGNDSTTGPAATSAVAKGTATPGSGVDKQVSDLNKLNLLLGDVEVALQKSDFTGAKAAFQKFSNGWFDVEDYVKAQSKDRYKSIEDSLAEVSKYLIYTDKPVTTEVQGALAKLKDKYSEAIKAVQAGNSASGAGNGTKPAVISGSEVEAATTKVSDYLKGKADDLVKSTAEFTANVKARDLAKAKVGYEKARFDYESIEFLGASFKELDHKVDGRANDFPQGEMDPQWTGFHPLEKAIFVDGKLDERTEKLADQLNLDIAALRDQIKDLKIEPAMALSGAAELIEEIQSGKITGEEERYSHTDLNDFRANLLSAKLVYNAYAPFTRQRNAALDKSVQDSFSEVENSIAVYFEPGGKAASYNTLDDKNRKLIAQKVEGLADNFSKVAGTLGLQS